MNVRFLTGKERKQFIEQLQEFGAQETNYLFLETGKEKIRAFSGSLSKEDLLTLGEDVRIELIGLYFAKQEPFGLRLSFDGCHMMGAKDRIVQLTDEERQIWMKGHPLQRTMEKGVYLVQSNGDFLGCAYSNGKTLFNYVPKERQVRN